MEVWMGLAAWVVALTAVSIVLGWVLVSARREISEIRDCQFAASLKAQEAREKEWNHQVLAVHELFRASAAYLAAGQKDEKARKSLSSAVAMAEFLRSNPDPLAVRFRMPYPADGA